jgi:F-type H+-transporting ATPase subunit b
MFLDINLVLPDVGLFFWQFVVFLVVLFVLSRYAWKPITDALKAREQSITDALSQAEKARQEMQQLQSNNQKLLDEARLERDKMLKAAQKQADETREEARKRAESDVKRMMDEASRAIETEKQAAIDDMKKQIASLSVEIATTLLKRELSAPEQQQALVADLIKDVKLN